MKDGSPYWHPPVQLRVLQWEPPVQTTASESGSPYWHPPVQLRVLQWEPPVRTTAAVLLIGTLLFSSGFCSESPQYGPLRRFSLLAPSCSAQGSAVRAPSTDHCGGSPYWHPPVQLRVLQWEPPVRTTAAVLLIGTLLFSSGFCSESPQYGPLRRFSLLASSCSAQGSAVRAPSTDHCGGSPYWHPPVQLRVLQWEPPVRTTDWHPPVQLRVLQWEPPVRTTAAALLIDILLFSSGFCSESPQYGPLRRFSLLAPSCSAQGSAVRAPSTDHCGGSPYWHPPVQLRVLQWEPPVRTTAAVLLIGTLLFSSGFCSESPQYGPLRRLSLLAPSCSAQGSAVRAPSTDHCGGSPYWHPPVQLRVLQWEPPVRTTAAVLLIGTLLFSSGFCSESPQYGPLRGSSPYWHPPVQLRVLQWEPPVRTTVAVLLIGTLLFSSGFCSESPQYGPLRQFSLLAPSCSAQGSAVRAPSTDHCGGSPYWHPPVQLRVLQWYSADNWIPHATLHTWCSFACWSSFLGIFLLSGRRE